MPSRRTVLALPLALAACDTPKPKIIGHQVPVLESLDALSLSVDAPPVILPPATALADWPQALANPAHAPGNAAGPTGMNIAWSTRIGAAGGYRQPLLSAPIVAENHVFAMDANGFVTAHSLTDGSRLWRADTRPGAEYRRRHRLCAGPDLRQHRLCRAGGDGGRHRPHRLAPDHASAVPHRAAGRRRAGRRHRRAGRAADL
jgi:hypothetical protein